MTKMRSLIHYLFVFVMGIGAGAALDPLNNPTFTNWIVAGLIVIFAGVENYVYIKEKE